MSKEHQDCLKCVCQSFSAVNQRFDATFLPKTRRLTGSPLHSSDERMRCWTSVAQSHKSSVPACLQHGLLRTDVSSCWIWTYLPNIELLGVIRKRGRLLPAVYPTGSNSLPPNLVRRNVLWKVGQRWWRLYCGPHDSFCHISSIAYHMSQFVKEPLWMMQVVVFWKE